VDESYKEHWGRERGIEVVMEKISGEQRVLRNVGGRQRRREDRQKTVVGT
jgi:hypothetical protein